MRHLLVPAVALICASTPGPGVAAPIRPEVGSDARSRAATGLRDHAADEVAEAEAVPGREQDARVARVAYHLAIAGRARCPVRAPVLGLVIQHLSQFELGDRPGVVAAAGLDRGPGVIAVVGAAPGGRSGVRAGDVLLAIDGVAIPADTDLTRPFSPARAHARADAVSDLLDVAASHAFALSVWRDGAVLSRRVVPERGCPSRVELARSAQHNAFADGRHVFLTTGVLALVRDDDELAFVIAHEMAHNILGHAAVMRGGQVAHGLGRHLGKSGALIRASEREADRLAGELMLDAGYDPVAGAQLLQRFGTDLGIALFAAHDAAGTRIDAIRALAQARRVR